jgi:hypothetical protein
MDVNKELADFAQRMLNPIKEVLDEANRFANEVGHIT